MALIRETAPAVDGALILDSLILAGGPPRSGTTLLAKLLNLHPRIAVAVDNSVYESWALYYYGTRNGLIKGLRRGVVSPAEAQEQLLRYVVQGSDVWGLAASPQVAAFPVVPWPVRPDAARPPARRVRRRASQLLQRTLPGRQSKRRRKRFNRYAVPVEHFQRSLRLGLKSPEISFVLPELSHVFPGAQFVLVYRPVLEIAESMYRKGNEWKLPSYHRRWSGEVDERGDFVAPPGVPDEWHGLWRTATDFQRCVLYAASYVRAIALGVPQVAPERILVYDHADLRATPAKVLAILAQFLGVEYSGFDALVPEIESGSPWVATGFRTEYQWIEDKIRSAEWVDEVARLSV